MPGVYRIEAGLQDYYVAMSGSAEVCRNTTVSYSPSHSYTATRTYLTASGDTWRESVRYSDGLGRLLQDVQVGASPDGSSDLIQPYVYGRGGRVEKSFLPYPSSGNRGNFDAGFSDPSNWTVYGAADRSNAFGLTEYDGSPSNRVTKQTGPGVEPVYYVYDGKDRAVLSQDGNRWSYTLYDSQNRATETGEVVLAGKTTTQLRSEACVSKNYLPSGTRTALQYSLYDSYTASPVVTPHAFLATSGYAATYHPLVTGQLTAVKTRILGSDTWQTTTLYYDDCGRVIQTVSNNR